MSALRRWLSGAVLALPLLALAQSPCGAPTPRDSEGPYYAPGAPRRSSLVEPETRGERLILSGSVLSRSCQPLAGATLDFWQTDEKGEYDNSGFRYRGVVQTDAQGRYRLESVVPGRYPGRPRHLHVKVQAPGARLLTTQVYFPDEVRGGLAMRVVRRDGVAHGEFDFVLPQ